MWEFLKGLFGTLTSSEGRANAKRWTEYTVDETGFWEVVPSGCAEGKKHLWSDVLHVTIVTTSDGPWFDDFFYVIKSTTGFICISSEDAQKMNLLQRFECLPGFQWEKVVEAAGSVTDATFDCWDSSWTPHAA